MAKTAGRRWPPLVVGLAFCVVAFVVAVLQTSHLEVPPDSDHYRDMGSAQAILDGNLLGDPVYEGELRWYNPLVPSVVAGLAKITGRSLLDLYTHAGVYLNLLAPLAFFLLVATVFGRWQAVGAVFAYLFLYPHAGEVWHHATYSPWLWPLNTSQALTYLCLASVWRSLHSDRLAWHVGSGVLLGITFLAHTAPALIIATVLVVLTGLGAVRSEGRDHLYRLFWVGAVSFLVSLPFLGPLFVRYRFAILNEAPLRFVHLYPMQVVDEFLTARAMVAAATCVIALIAAHRLFLSRDQRRFILTLVVVTGLFLTYGMVAIFVEPRTTVSFPRIVPTLHFHLYMTAWAACLFGVGVFAAARHLVGLFSSTEDSGRFATVGAPTVVVVLLALVLVLLLPAYSARYDLTTYVERSLVYAEDRSTLDLYHWLLENTAPEDVVLADGRLGLLAIGAAGRKVVAPDRILSNPYVDFETRYGDRQVMFDALAAGDVPAFSRLADLYSVDYVAVDKSVPENLGPSECCWLPADIEHPMLSLTFQSDDVRVYRVAAAAAGARN